MNSFLIAFLTALGAGTWVYTRMMRSSGGITQTALTVAGVVAFFVFLIIFTVANMLSS